MRQFRTAACAFGLPCLLQMLLVSAASAQSTSNEGESRSFLPWVVVGALLIGAILVGIMRFYENSPFGLRSTTSMDQDETLKNIVNLYTIAGWRVSSRSSESASFYKRINPSLAIAFLLVFFAVIPALIYLMIGGRDLTVTVNTVPLEPSGTEIKVIGNASGYGGKRTAARIMDAFPAQAATAKISSLMNQQT